MREPAEERRRRPAPEGVASVVESLMHLLPTAASVFDAEGEILVAEEAAPVCRLLARPPDGAPDLCARDCHALAAEALSSGGRSRGTCTAGLPCVAEPVLDPQSGRVAGVLVAAVGAPPTDTDHWLEVAARFARDPDEVLGTARAMPGFDLPEWEGIERLEVAAIVLTRVLADEDPKTAGGAPSGAAPLARPPRSVSARRQLALLVLDLAHAAGEAVDEAELLRYLCERVGELVGFRDAWALLLDRTRAEDLPTPPGLESAGRDETHPARRRPATHATYHADLGDWPEASALAAAGIERLHVAPVHAFDRLAALLFFAADPRDETPATIARRSALLDDLTPIVGAHLTRLRASRDARVRLKRLRAVHEAAAKPSASLDSNAVLAAIVDAVVDALGYRRGAVFLHDEASGELVGAASRSDGGRDRIRRVRGPLETFPVALEAAQVGRPLHVHGEDRRAVPEGARRLFDVADFVVAPLIAHGRVLGFLVADEGGEAFETTDEDLDLLGVLAQSASHALALTREHEAATDARNALDAVRRLGESIAAGTAVEAALLAVVETLPGVAATLLVAQRSLPSSAAVEPSSETHGTDRVPVHSTSELGPRVSRLLPEACDDALVIPLPSRDHALVVGLAPTAAPTRAVHAALSALAATAAAAGAGAPSEATPPLASVGTPAQEDIPTAAAPETTDLAPLVNAAIAQGLAAAPRGLDLVRLVVDVPPVVAPERAARHAVQRLVDAAVTAASPGSRVVVATGVTDDGDHAYVRVVAPAGTAVPEAFAPGDDANGAAAEIRLETEGPDEEGRPSRRLVFAVARRPAEGLRIVLVDDDEDARELVAALVRRWGHEPIVAEDGDSALARLDEGADLLISDLVMPGMGGWELARRVAARTESERRVPILLLTGWSLDLDDDEVRRRGARRLLQKPTRPERLKREIDAVVAEAASRRGSTR